MSVNLANLKSSHQSILLLVDLFMLVLLFINLLWLVIDTLYGIELINELLLEQFPTIVETYRPIHANFLLVDMVFVSVFLLEFAARWIISIKQKEYYRWYFYPFAHWYDLIGCIPVGPYRFLRVLRVASILYRLHKYQILDLSQTALYRFLSFYYHAFVEEVSDRVVVNVLRGTQTEIQAGSPVVNDVLVQVLLPRRHLLVNWLSDHLEKKTAQALNDYELDIKDYVQKTVSRAVYQNEEVERLKSTPFIGGALAETLSDAITDIVFQTLINILKDLSTQDNKTLISDLMNTVLTPINSNEISDKDVRDVLIEIIQRVIDQVSVQRWKNETVQP